MAKSYLFSVAHQATTWGIRARTHPNTPARNLCSASSVVEVKHPLSTNLSSKEVFPALLSAASIRQGTGTMAVDKLVTDPILASALQISSQGREQASTLISLAEKNNGNTPLSPAHKAEIAKQQTLFLSSIAQLRGLHRHATLAARETKAQTAEARQEVDRLHLQLQNLYYEQRHLQNEITACESYEYVPGLPTLA